MELHAFANLRLEVWPTYHGSLGKPLTLRFPCSHSAWKAASFLPSLIDELLFTLQLIPYLASCTVSTSQCWINAFLLSISVVCLLQAIIFYSMDMILTIWSWLLTHPLTHTHWEFLRTAFIYLFCIRYVTRICYSLNQHSRNEIMVPWCKVLRIWCWTGDMSRF